MPASADSSSTAAATLSPCMLFCRQAGRGAGAGGQQLPRACPITRQNPTTQQNPTSYQHAHLASSPVHVLAQRLAGLAERGQRTKQHL